jgi:RimJ/RimL family protein N-acetyltransferase
LHCHALFEANSIDTNGEMWLYLPYGPFSSLQHYRDWMRSFCTGSDPLFYAIVESATAKAIGVASYLRIDHNNGVIEVGHLAYSPLLKRTRAATEAMYLMMQHAFELGYRRYEWKCNALNMPSRAAAERLGFTFEGIFRQAAVIKGHNRDTAWYSVIDKEWPELKLAFEKWLAEDNFDADGRHKVSLSSLTSAIKLEKKSDR